MREVHERGCLCGKVRSAHRWFTPPAGVETFEKGTLPTPPK